MSNGYPNSSSPLGESPPPPGASPGGKGGKHSPHSAAAAGGAGRSSLRVLIPSQAAPLGHDQDDVAADSCHSNGDRLFDEVSVRGSPGLRGRGLVSSPDAER